MRLITYIILAMSISTNLFGSWAGFPILEAQSTKTWLQIQDAGYIEQLFEAINERCIAADITPITYVEDVKVDAEWFEYDGQDPTNITFEIGTLFAEEWTDTTNDPPIIGTGFNTFYYRGSSSPHEWWVDEVNYGVVGEWLTPTTEDFDSDFFSWLTFDYTLEEQPPQRYVTVTNISVTNTFGYFDITVGDTNYTGVVGLTRDLLDTMWDKIEELSEHFVIPGDESISGGLSSFDTWFSAQDSMDVYYGAFAGALRGTTNDSLYELRSEDVFPKTYRLKPYVMNAYPALTFKRLAEENAGFDNSLSGLSNAYYRLESNSWGYVTNGIYKRYPIQNRADAYTGRIRLAEAVYKITNIVENVVGDVTNYTYQSGWVTTESSLNNTDGIDARHYTDESTTNHTLAQLTYNGGSNDQASLPDVEAAIEGRYYYRNYTEVTNREWNATWSSSSVVTSTVLSNLVYSIDDAVLARPEELNIGGYSTNIWHSINKFDVSGSAPTGTSVQLVWDVSHWDDIRYRLYAEELDRMYYVLNDMRYTAIVRGENGILTSPTNRMIFDTDLSITRETTPYKLPTWEQGILDTYNTGAVDVVSYLLRDNYLTDEPLTIGEFDSSRVTDTVFYQFNPAETNVTRLYPNIYENPPPPWYWPQTLTTNRYFPSVESLQGDLNTPTEGWLVLTGITIDERAPAKSVVVAEIDEINLSAYRRGVAAGGIGGGGDSPNTLGYGLPGQPNTGGGGAAGYLGDGGSGVVFVRYQATNAIASGGTVSDVYIGDYPNGTNFMLHSFYSSGSFDMPIAPDTNTISIFTDVIIVGGGGSGERHDPSVNFGGGGGGGEVLVYAVELSYGTNSVMTNVVVVGAGGEAASQGDPLEYVGQDGQQSSFAVSGGTTYIASGGKKGVNGVGGADGSLTYSGGAAAGFGGGGGAGSAENGFAAVDDWLGGDGGAGTDLSGYLTTAYGDNGYFGGGGAGGDNNQNELNTSRLPYGLHNRIIGSAALDDISAYPDYLRLFYENGEPAGWEYRYGDTQKTNGVATGVISTIDAFGAWAGAASLVFDYGLTTGQVGLFGSAKLFKGDFSEAIFSSENVVDWQHPLESVFDSFVGITDTTATYSGDDDLRFVGGYPPLMWDSATTSSVPVKMLFNGNGQITASGQMESESITIGSDAGSNYLRLEMFGEEETTPGNISLPASPGDPETTEWFDTDPNARYTRARWAGFRVSELYLIVDWTFQYR